MNNSVKRFSFGKNWLGFLKHVNEERIKEAEISLKKMLNVTNLKGKSFLDVGCGSGLFSLAAFRLGAKVVSFDYDKQSVEATKSLKDKYCDDMKKWQVFEGSVLSTDFLKRLDKFDYVYSWGVLHHTGNMYSAMENILITLKHNGVLFIAIYNKQQFFTKFWHLIKRIYNQSPLIIQRIIGYIFFVYFLVGLFVFDTIRFKNPILRHSGKGRRGMSFYTDIIDWIGGWPFEVATPDEIFDFYYSKDLNLSKIKTCGNKMGCNEFVFRR